MANKLSPVVKQQILTFLSLMWSHSVIIKYFKDRNIKLSKGNISYVKKKSLNSENNEEKVETRGRKSILTEIQKTTLRRMTENPNAFVERLFSIMKKACKDDRNKMSTSIIKAEICTKINYNLSCSEFYEFVMNNKLLL